MFRTIMLTLLFVQFSNSFSFDIVVATDKQLEFYYVDGTRYTQDIPSAGEITSVTYDPVNYRVLFADKHGSSTFLTSFDVSTKRIQRLVTTPSGHHVRVVYDPVTQALYWGDAYTRKSKTAMSIVYSVVHRIRTFSLNPASSNQTDGNLSVKLDQDHYCHDFAVDSCGGYIYWIADEEIGRIRLDGSEREVLINNKVYERRSLAIDQQTQKLYWIERTHSDGSWSLESANFNGMNRTTLYIIGNTHYTFSLAVSKDFIYWQNYGEQGIWRLPKYSTQTVATKLTSTFSSVCTGCHRIAANYTIKEQIQGIKTCNALLRLIPNDSKSESTAPLCQNYCIQGECSISAEGQPTCSCLTGYAGKRCEVSICKDYCFQGNCSVGAEGQPKCSCMPGYAGERCEENACHKHCLNGGVCTLNEEDEPACQCTAGYDGGRCELPAYKGNSFDAGNSGKGTVSACHQFCLNHGACSLDEAREPVCQCTPDYEGERCELSVNKDSCCPTVTKVTVTLSHGVQPTCASTVV